MKNKNKLAIIAFLIAIVAYNASAGAIIEIIAGSGINITQVGNVVTISATGGGGGNTTNIFDVVYVNNISKNDTSVNQRIDVNADIQFSDPDKDNKIFSPNGLTYIRATNNLVRFRSQDAQYITEVSVQPNNVRYLISDPGIASTNYQSSSTHIAQTARDSANSLSSEIDITQTSLDYNFDDGVSGLTNRYKMNFTNITAIPFSGNGDVFICSHDDGVLYITPTPCRKLTVNNTDLYGIERVQNVNYSRPNDIQLMIIGHVVGAVPAKHLDMNVSVDGVVVQDIDIKTSVGVGVHEHQSISLIIPSGSNYTLQNSSDVTQIEWREYLRE